MRNRSKLILAALAATMLLSLAVSNASANRLSVTEKNFEAIWNSNLGGVKTDLSFIDEGGHTVTCKVTLLGSFTANTITKTTTTTQGNIHHATIGTCANGSATVLAETLPWPIRYRSFGGTLPNGITSITIGLLRASFRVEVGGGLSCLAGTEANRPGVGILETFSSGAPENIRADETRTISLEGFICSFVSPTRFKGTGLVRDLPGTAKVTVTLI